jgi:hypothetical protein
LHLHLRVDLPDGRYTLVPEGGDGGANKELQYMDVAQDLDQSPEGLKANLSSEGKPRIINPVFKIMQLPRYDCAFTFQELNWNPNCMIPRYLCSITSMLGR